MKVFISYAREDIKIAEKLQDDLEKAGIKTWLDKEYLLPGQDWKNAIHKAMQNADFLILLLSSHSLVKRGYVQKELKMALDLLDEFPKDRIFVIPVRLDKCEPQDEQLKNLHWADLFPSYRKGFQDILRVLSQHGQYPNISDSQKTKEDVPEKKEAVQNEGQPLKAEFFEKKSENTRSISAGDAEKSVLGSGDGNVINIIHQNNPITGNIRRQQLLSQLEAGKITIDVFNAEWNKLNDEKSPVPKAEPAFQPQAPKAKYQLRKKPITVWDDNFKKVFGLDDDSRPLEYLENEFKDNGNGTITDYATGLIWQKSGSSDRMTYKRALEYIKGLNGKKFFSLGRKFAGHNDWRLPTIDELKSLLTSEKQSNGLYINPIFDKKQYLCWTSNIRCEEDIDHFAICFDPLSVNFDRGYMDNLDAYIGYSYIRAVRSIQ